METGLIIIALFGSCSAKKGVCWADAPLCTELPLLFLTEPPLEILSSLFSSLIFFGLKARSEFLSQFHEFLMRQRKPAALAYIALRNRCILELTATLWTIPHFLRLF
jgi:hypothetical protein